MKNKNDVLIMLTTQLNKGSKGNAMINPTAASSEIPLTFDIRDEYQRKSKAQNIIRLLTSDTTVSPLIIDGGWGTGKTEFCQKLIQLILNDAPDLRPVYIDAFRADHADEPLMTILAAVIKLLPENDQQSLIKKAVPALRFGAKTALKAGVSWVLKQDATDIADDFESDLKKAGDEAINHAVELMLNDHMKADESIIALQKTLMALVKENPVVIFIDELDRCRPDFAISMLESIKHVFSVEGVQFVLVVNLEQLEATVNHCYGDKVVARQYLDKFIGFRFVLSDVVERNHDGLVLASQKHFSLLVEASSLLQNSILSAEEVLRFTNQLIAQNNLSLREVESFIIYLEIYHTLENNEGLTERLFFGVGLLRILGVYLCCFNPEFVKNLDPETSDAQSILSVLGVDKPPSLDDYYPSHIEAIATMIGSESTTSGFMLGTKKSQIKWEDIIWNYFKGGHISPETKKLSYVVHVANTLMLG